MSLTHREKQMLIAGFMGGYEQGHHDTVESQYSDAKECGEDWLSDVLFNEELDYCLNATGESDE